MPHYHSEALCLSKPYTVLLHIQPVLIPVSELFVQMATRLPSILSQLSFPACVGWFPWTELNIETTQGKVEKSKAGNVSQ